MSKIIFYASNNEEYAQLKVYNTDNVRYGCTKCRKTYSQKKTLGRHLRFDCGQVPTFACTVCGKKFKHGYILLKHMRHTHEINIQKLRHRHVRTEMVTSSTFQPVQVIVEESPGSDGEPDKSRVSVVPEAALKLIDPDEKPKIYE
nr:unnamed protein product [Callosobruchus analis]